MCLQYWPLQGTFSRFDRNVTDRSSLLLTSFTVLAAEAHVRVFLVLHTVQLSCCAVLEVSCKPKLCRSMTHTNQSNENSDLENEREISICIHVSHVGTWKYFGFALLNLKNRNENLNIQNKNIINIYI